jgi:hypothetical protein
MIGNRRFSHQKVEFVPKHPNLLDIYEPPKSAKVLMPDWYKEAPATINREPLKISEQGKRNGTYKKCVPFMDAMTSGYIVTLPADVLVSTLANGIPHFQWMVAGDIVAMHGSKEHPGFPIPNGYSNRVFTWIGQYLIRTPKGYSCLYTHPINNYDLPFKVISGVVDTDKHPMPVDNPFIIKKDFTGVLPAGTPVCQILPFKRESWVSERVVLPKHDLDNGVNSYLRNITSAYRSSVWARKSYE